MDQAFFGKENCAQRVLARHMDRVEDRLAKIELRQEATVQAVLHGAP